MIFILFTQGLLIVTKINYLSFLHLTFICHTLLYLSVPFNAKLILLFYINIQKLLRFKQNIAYKCFFHSDCIIVCNMHKLNRINKMLHVPL